jgi:hypothetical protein
MVFSPDFMTEGMTVVFVMAHPQAVDFIADMTEA